MKYDSFYKILYVTSRTTSQVSSGTEQSLIWGGCNLTQNGIPFTNVYIPTVRTLLPFSVTLD